MLIKYSSILALLCLLTQKSQSICNFIYLESFAYQLDTCNYNSYAGYSYGYYCTLSYNGTSYSDQKVVELYFPVADCEGGLESEDAILEGIYDCEDDCHCDGTPDDCTISTERYYDFDSSLIDSSTNNPGCNGSYWNEYKYAWKNICLARGDVGSFSWSCSTEYGTQRVSYEDQSCSTDSVLVGTPSPTIDNPCYFYACSEELEIPTWDERYTEKEGSGGLVFIVIGVIVAVVICCICIAAIWCFIQRKQKKEVTFDHGNTSGGTSW